MIIDAPIVEPIEDEVYWNSRDLLTVHELSYLLFDTEPNPYDLHVDLVSEFEKYYPEKLTSPDYQDSLDKFKEIMRGYCRIAVHAKSLPTETTDQTHVAWYHQEHQEKIASYGYEPRFLVTWIQDRGFTVPSWFKPRESIYETQRKPKIQQFDSSQIMIDGWFNLDACKAPKLTALVYAYAKETILCVNNKNRVFSTTNVAQHLKIDNDIINGEGKDHDSFRKKLSEVASIKPTGCSLMKKLASKKTK